MSDLTPQNIVETLDRHIIGQKEAKRAVAVALRNRWRRRQLDAALRDEVTPKNILMIGPTGVGKTEIARRLAKLAGAPFVKVEASKFTEVGYVGRDVEQIVRDLVEAAHSLLTEKKREEVRKDAEQQAEERVLDALVGERASSATRESFRSRLYSGDLNDAPVDIEIEDHSNTMIEMSGQGGAQIGMVNLSDMLKGAFGGRTRTKRMTVEEAYDVLVEQEADKLIDQDALEREALDLAENDGIVFLDEVDKIVHRSSERSGGDVSREGVQRDLLPLIEGTVVSTKRGSVKTDFILFIASGAFHVASPSDLLPELQGRLPIRVELKALGRDDFVRILREPEASLTKQYAALLETEGVHLTFTDDGIDAMAGAAAEANAQIENIGARRLMTVIERVLDEASYSAGTDLTGDLTVDRTYVDTRLGDLLRDKDLSKYVL